MSAAVGDRVRVTAGELAGEEGFVDAICEGRAWIHLPAKSPTGWPFPSVVCVPVEDVQRVAA